MKKRNKGVKNMLIKEFIKNMPIRVLTNNVELDKTISGVYVCDLLSWVMANAKKDDIWITVHTNLNIVAVALMVEVTCIIIPENIKVEDATINRAEQEGIVILSTDLSAYELCINAHKIINGEDK